MATSFYTERDEPLSQQLVLTLLETNQEIPEFLQHLVPEGEDRANLKFESEVEAPAEFQGGGDGDTAGGWNGGGQESGAAAAWGGGESSGGAWNTSENAGGNSGNNWVGGEANSGGW